ncbi:MAG: phosphoribosylformylglycinamidine synthase subunit PurS [Actinobacteria bacterium]|nr:phosphoribosylformylglycinamidine synthase subunit PurS [Actinomycetota bacterium]
MKKYIVTVKLKPSVLDPQGETVKRAIEHLGYKGVESVRIGKYIEILADEDLSTEKVTEIADKLLANPVIETFEVKMEDE